MGLVREEGQWVKVGEGGDLGRDYLLYTNESFERGERHPIPNVIENY
jgi:hypothetical protein